MKFLHTADLHLGKVFHEHSLIDDQAYMLDGLAEILEDADYRALLIAGDVYDRAIPQAEAVNLFSRFLGNLKARRPDLAVLVLPGNHDSSSRLGFGRELLAELGVHFVTQPEDAASPILVKAADGAETAFFLLPFLAPGSLRRESGDDGEQGEFLRSQAALAGEAAARLEQARLAALARGAAHAVLGAHLFAAGCAESESERVFLGTAERVHAGLFAGFDYTALGHLHRFQKAGENAWYAGSPLAYSFEEAKYTKVFLSVELEKNAAPEPHPLPVKPRRKLQCLRGDFSYFFGGGEDPVLTGAAEDYLEITLTGKELTENPLALLRPRFPFILAIKQEAAQFLLRSDTVISITAIGNIAAGSNTDGSAAYSSSTIPERRGVEHDFVDFLAELYGDAGGTAASADKTALVLELLRELDAAEAEA